MSLAAAFAIAALAASVVLLKGNTPYAIVAIIVSGLEVALAFGLISLSIGGLPLGLVLGAVLLGAGAISYNRSGGKPQVAAATVVALIGAIQVLSALRLLES